MNNQKEKQLTLADFHSYTDSGDITDKLKTQEKFLEFINMQPPQEWVANHQFINGHKYLPIDKVEFLLKSIFKYYKIEVLGFDQLLDSIACHVRVHYLHPISKEWMFQDGVGAWEIQTNKGSGKLKIDGSNSSKSAITMALPIAKSEAIKDACDLIGDIFGGNLSRKNSLQFYADSSTMNLPDTKPKQRLLEQQSIIPDVVTENVVYDVPPMPPLYEMSKQNGQTLYNMFCDGKIVDEALVFINDSGFGMNKEIVDWVNSVYNHYLQHNV